MFTPPASPLPRPIDPLDTLDTPLLTPSPTPSLRSLSPEPAHRPASPQPSSTLKAPVQTATILVQAEATHTRKLRLARRTRFSVIVVPLVLILIALSTRLTSHPAVLSLLGATQSEAPSLQPNPPQWGTHSGHGHMHERRQANSGVTASGSVTQSGIAFPSSVSGTPTGASASPSGTQSAGGSVPTIPTSPPVLPTPFPQAFDTTMNNNYSTTSCQQFITNMTSTEPFRQCRPFSFLSQTSSAFIQAQSNISALNVDIWGTCNTPLSQDQCVSNMAWFASQLPQQCQKDLDDQNATVMQAQQGLQTYSLMRQAACLADQSTSTYCYVEASLDSNPSDLYYYSLPFGISMANTTTPTCSPCTKSVMALFYPQVSQIDGLKKTYAAAAKIASSQCGQDYVQTAATTSSASPLLWDKGRAEWSLLAVASSVLFTFGGF